MLPARCRDTLLQAEEIHQLVVTIDTESPCLLLYPVYEWHRIEQKIQGLSSFNKATRRIQRLLIGHATEVEIDNSGRVLIAPMLREYAKLEKEVVLIGQGNKFEIWDKTTWHRHRDEWLAEETKDSKDIPTELQDLAL